MSLAIMPKPSRKVEEKSPTPTNMRRLSDEAAEIIRRHQAGELDVDEAGRRLNDLKRRDRNFIDRLIG